MAPEFYRGTSQVGSGPQARAFAAWSGDPNDPNLAFPPEILVPYGYGERPGFGRVTPPMPYAPPPDPTLANYETLQSGGYGVRGRPNATRLGVQPEMGGMPQPEDRTFAPSNVLIQKALANLPPVFSMFANRPINRYHATDIYGDVTNQGGYYEMPIGVGDVSQPPGGPIEPVPQTVGPPTVNVGIGNDVSPFQSRYGPADAEGVLRHELIHAVSYEAQPFASDAQNNFTLLREASAAAFPSLQAPQYHVLARQVANAASAQDWAHVFTVLAEANLRGVILPPALQQYFAPMYQAAPVTPGRAPMTAPPAARR